MKAIYSEVPYVKGAFIQQKVSSFLRGKAGPEVSPARLSAGIRQKAMRAQPSSFAGGRPNSLRPVST